MWDQMAEDFEKRRPEALEQPVIVAVSSCRVTRFRGISMKPRQHLIYKDQNLNTLLNNGVADSYQLTATSATECYLNPKIPEVDEARAE